MQQRNNLKATSGDGPTPHMVPRMAIISLYTSLWPAAILNRIINAITTTSMMTPQMIVFFFKKNTRTSSTP